MARGGKGAIQGVGSTNRRPNGGPASRQGLRQGRRSAISTLLKNQEYLRGRIRSLTRQQQNVVAVRKDGGNRKRTRPTRYFSSLQRSGGRSAGVNISINRAGTQRGRGRSRGGAISALSRKSLARDQPPRRGRSSAAGRGRGRGRGGRPPTVADLDAQLDEYMGDEVRKARMDTELDAYFNRAGEDTKISTTEEQAR